MNWLQDPRRWTLPDLLRERVQTHGDETLITCALGDGRLTYGEADALSGRLAGLWSRWVWVHRMAATRSPPSAAVSMARCGGRSGPGSITATSPSPIM